MLKISELAQTKIKEALDNYKKPVVGIKAVAQVRSPFQISYGLAFVDDNNVNKSDKILEIGEIKIYIEIRSPYSTVRFFLFCKHFLKNFEIK